MKKLKDKNFVKKPKKQPLIDIRKKPQNHFLGTKKPKITIWYNQRKGFRKPGKTMLSTLDFFQLSGKEVAP